MRRFRVGSLEPDESGLLHVDAGVQRHLRVLRLGPGDVVHLFDGRGGEVEAQIAAIGDSRASLRPVGSVDRRVESPLDSCLVQAVPARSSRMDTIVRQVTELGVRRIVPVLAERSQQAEAGAAALASRAERWRRVADAAAEQCGRTLVPEIDTPASFRELAWQSLPWPLFIADVGATPGRDSSRVEVSGGDGSDGAVADGEETDGGAPRGAGPGGRETVAASGIDALPRADAVSLLIGPEGGWSPGEIDAAVAEGARTLTLGPRVLRADTAGAVGVALFQLLWGDLQGALSGGVRPIRGR